MIKPPLDVNAAGRLSTCIRLREIVCVGLEAKHLSPATEVADANLGWDVPPVQVIWELEKAELKVIVPFSLFIEAHELAENIERSGKARTTRLAEIGVGLRLEYDIEGSVDSIENDIPHYAGITSYLHAWPYFRADIQALSTKLGFPPLVLPVIVSGYPASQVSVIRLSEVKATPALSRTSNRKKARRPEV